jgi:hypothetical protein
LKGIIIISKAIGAVDKISIAKSGESLILASEIVPQVREVNFELERR